LWGAGKKDWLLAEKRKRKGKGKVSRKKRK